MIAVLYFLGLCLAGLGYYLLNRRIRHRRRRKSTGLVLIILGASATIGLDTWVDDIFVWGFVAIWCTGLELFFNDNKYRDEYS